MPFDADTDFSTGVYRCYDIASLKIRVFLKTVKSSSVPLSGLQEDERNREDDRLEEQVFSWQQRVFSPWEVKFYSNIENCKSELHKKYHEEVLQIINDETNKKNNCIFSNISQDVESRAERGVLHGGYKAATYLSRSVNQLSLSCLTEVHHWDVPKQNIVDLHPNLETIKHNHTLSSPVEFMYIMADVGYLTEGKVDEQVLIYMKWEPLLQVITVFPDFNDSLTGPGYTLEGVSDACYQYFFWVTLLSKTSEGVPEYKKETVKEESKCQPTSVMLPRHVLLDVFLYGEIKSAQYFDCDCIFVSYFIDLPKGWIHSSSSNLFGVTQRCKNFNGFFTINHLFDCHLTLDLSTSEEESSTSSKLLFPQLLLEVISMDSWGRICREGYGWILIPPSAGSHHFNVHTWRPHTIDSRINLLRRYFVGATSHLADRTYFGVPRSFHGNSLSKYGFGTYTCGNVNVNLNIVLQSQDSRCIPSRAFLLERMSTASLVESINITLKAFSSARQRLFKAGLSVKGSSD